MNKKRFLLLATLGFTSISYAQIPTDARDMVRQLIQNHYGVAFNHEQDCYVYDYTAYAEYGAEKKAYCVKIIDAQLKNINTLPTLYLTVSGDVMDESSVGRIETGLGGLFILQKHNQNWDVLAKSPYIPSGGAGMSQMSDYKLVEIAQNRYGWIGEESASGAGGESSTDWRMYAPMGKDIKPIAEITTEHSYDFADNTYVDDQGTVTVDNSQAMVNGYYPLMVNLTLERGRLNKNYDRVGKKVKTAQYRVTFNPKIQKFEAIK
ncbi:MULTISPECIES: hypothetical protein [unclassified Acinetobacter]|uniref:hypothetical protein n=1 Tax=unclassified Acinetobacter TaxID=196816 RepID=UPI0035B7E2D6